jgi:hypothetical protein
MPVDRYDRVHSLLHCTWGLLPATRLASRKYLLSKIAKSGQGHHSVYSVVLPATRLASRKILIEQNIKKQKEPALSVLCGAPPPPPPPTMASIFLGPGSTERIL